MYICIFITINNHDYIVIYGDRFITEFLLGISPQRLAHNGSARRASSTTSSGYVLTGFNHPKFGILLSKSIKNDGFTIQISDSTINNAGLALRIWYFTIKYVWFHQQKWQLKQQEWGLNRPKIGFRGFTKKKRTGASFLKLLRSREITPQR